VQDRFKDESEWFLSFLLCYWEYNAYFCRSPKVSKSSRLGRRLVRHKQKINIHTASSRKLTQSNTLLISAKPMWLCLRTVKISKRSRLYISRNSKLIRYSNPLLKMTILWIWMRKDKISIRMCSKHCNRSQRGISKHMSCEEILKESNPKRILNFRRDQVHRVGILNYYRWIATMMGRNSSTTIATTMMHRSLRDRKIKRKVVWKLEYFKERGRCSFFSCIFLWLGLVSKKSRMSLFS